MLVAVHSRPSPEYQVGYYGGGGLDPLFAPAGDRSKVMGAALCEIF